jgi:hypothetical protein
MATAAADVYDRLVALRNGVLENLWMGRVEGTLLSVFDELLSSAKRLSPDDRVLKVIEPSPRLSASALAVVIDQILAALRATDRLADASERRGFDEHLAPHLDHWLNR